MFVPTLLEEIVYSRSLKSHIDALSLSLSLSLSIYIYIYIKTDSGDTTSPEVMSETFNQTSLEFELISVMCILN